nr:cyclomaltodextrinase N-terminal domain-containing protein [Chitinophagaceae bacterium]
MTKFWISALLIVLSISAWAQRRKVAPTPPAPVANCYPTHWWPGMQWNKVQVLVKGETTGFNSHEVSLQYPGVTLDKVTRLENSKYYALDLTIAPNAVPGDVLINFTMPAQGKQKAITRQVKWPLKQRRTGKGSQYAQGITSEDLVYLIMPDRFSNGDTTNDRIPGMRDQ